MGILNFEREGSDRFCLAILFVDLFLDSIPKHIVDITFELDLSPLKELTIGLILENCMWLFSGTIGNGWVLYPTRLGLLEQKSNASV